MRLIGLSSSSRLIMFALAAVFLPTIAALEFELDGTPKIGLNVIVKPIPPNNNNHSASSSSSQKKGSHQQKTKRLLLKMGSHQQKTKRLLLKMVI
uniref:Secreted protein n=1 Tax=Globodera pallida TaxID=36090 RepID=A0A183C7W9_GLOPA